MSTPPPLPRRRWLVAVDVVALVGAAALGGKIASHLLHHANAPVAPVLAALTTHADPPDPAPQRPHKLVIAVLDGVGDAALVQAVRASTLPKPSFEAHVDVGTPSLSRPGYHVMLTGVSQSITGVRTNQHLGHARADTIADRVRASGGTVAWALAGVRWMHDLGAEPGELFLHGKVATTDEGFAQTKDASLVVFHIVETDGNGHAHGAASQQYRDAVARAVATVDRLRRLSPDAAWFVGADHGHTATGGHGGPEPDVTQVAWFGFLPSGDGQVVHPDRVSADRLAATFALAAGLPPPRHALGDALALPGVAAPPAPAARIERRRAVAEAQVASRDVSTRSLAALVFAPFFAHRRALAALAVPVAAMALHAVTRVGLTLSAMAEVVPYVVTATLVLALGAAVAWALVRNHTRAAWVAVAAAAFPVAAFAAHRGELSEVFGSTGLFGALVCGLVPTACVVAVGVVELFALLRRRT